MHLWSGRKEASLSSGIFFQIPKTNVLYILSIYSWKRRVKENIFYVVHSYDIQPYLLAFRSLGDVTAGAGAFNGGTAYIACASLNHTSKPSYRCFCYCFVVWNFYLSLDRNKYAVFICGHLMSTRVLDVVSVLCHWGKLIYASTRMLVYVWGWICMCICRITGQIHLSRFCKHRYRYHYHHNFATYILYVYKNIIGMIYKIKGWRSTLKLKPFDLFF